MPPLLHIFALGLAFAAGWLLAGARRRAVFGVLRTRCRRERTLREIAQAAHASSALELAETRHQAAFWRQQSQIAGLTQRIEVTHRIVEPREPWQGGGGAGE